MRRRQTAEGIIATLVEVGREGVGERGKLGGGGGKKRLWAIDRLKEGGRQFGNATTYILYFMD